MFPLYDNSHYNLYLLSFQCFQRRLAVSLTTGAKTHPASDLVGRSILNAEANHVTLLTLLSVQIPQKKHRENAVIDVDHAECPSTN